MNIIKFLIMIAIGILTICAGIRGWCFPSIHWFLRKMKFGEAINSFVIILLGILVIITALDIFVFNGLLS